MIFKILLPHFLLTPHSAIILSSNSKKTRRKSYSLVLDSLRSSPRHRELTEASFRRTHAVRWREKSKPFQSTKICLKWESRLNSEHIKTWEKKKLKKRTGKHGEEGRSVIVSISNLLIFFPTFSDTC